MSTPAAACLRTTSSTAERMRAPSSARSTGTPSSLAYIMRTRSSGRGRLPVCVVRKRSVLRFMDCLPDVLRDVFPLRSGMDFFGPGSINQHPTEVNGFGRITAFRFEGNKCCCSAMPDDCLSSRPQVPEPRRNHLLVEHRLRKKAHVLRKGVEGVHRVPGNLRIVKR